mgnify:CR=1 FL=1
MLLPRAVAVRAEPSDARKPWWLRLTARFVSVIQGLHPRGVYLDFVWCRPSRYMVETCYMDGKWYIFEKIAKDCFARIEVNAI